uniref:Uncharacterized protein n=1 Tax=Anguilla anguilla TaxID=7936 RepID=A0A0E9S2F2_ANGAN
MVENAIWWTFWVVEANLVCMGWVSCTYKQCPY